MYSQYYSNNFFFNFFPSLLFLLLIFLFSFQISFYLKKRNFLFFDNSPPIVFVVLISLFTILFNYLILLNYVSEINFFFYFVTVLILIFLLKNIKILLNIKFYLFKKKKYFNYLDKFKFLTLIIFFFISILPLSDADSVVTHLYFSAKILTDNNLILDLPKDIELLSYLNSEVLLIIAPILKSDNFGSQLNFFTLLLSFFFLKEKNNFQLLLLSCPLIIFFISTQKLQLFFALIYLFIVIYIFNFKIKNKIEIFLVCYLLIFYTSGKMYYSLFALPLFVIFLIKNKQFFKSIIFYSFVSFFLILFPILFKKYISLSNPLAPFFNNLFNHSNEFYEIISLSLRSSEGWVANSFDIKYLLRPFVPTSFSTLSSTLGPVFILLLAKYKEITKLFCIPYILIFFIIFTGQILPRYYFESFLILIYFVSSSFIIKIICKIQLCVIISFSLIFCFIAYFQTNIFFSKDEFMRRFTFLYDRSSKISKFNFTENVLNLDQSRESIFLTNNHYGSRYLNALNIFYPIEDYNKALIEFINKNKIKYITSNAKIYLPLCIKIKEVDNFSYSQVQRNFLIASSNNKAYIYQIIKNKCKINFN